MLDIAPTELLLVALVALVVIGPKDLPRVLRVVGQWVGRARGVARHFRSGFDEMVRQAEFEEIEKKWAEENARIMREHPPQGDGVQPEAPYPYPSLSSEVDSAIDSFEANSGTGAVTTPLPVAGESAPDNATPASDRAEPRP
jgi:sec-independent protein translocase protein TatB